jgi:hypothetical protein
MVAIMAAHRLPGWFTIVQKMNINETPSRHKTLCRLLDVEAVVA